MPAEEKGAGVPIQERVIEVAAAVVWRDREILLTRRPPGGPLGALWELPGGKLEPGETVEEALVREIAEELGVRAEPVEILERATHRYPHGLHVEIAFVRCRLEGTSFVPGEGVDAIRWCDPVELNLDEVLAADRDFLGRLAARQRSGSEEGG